MWTITRIGGVEFDGDVRKPNNVSAVEAAGDWLLLGSDETNRVQVLRRRGDRYEVSHDVVLGPEADEIDVEGIARDGDTFYVACSHSWKRKKLDPEDTYEENRAALEEVTAEPERDRVYRFRMGDDGTPSAVSDTTLRPFVDGHAVLGAFSRVPGKENGVDIEGVAARGGVLHAGFRGPVLRGNLTPVLRFRFADPVADAELVYVTLGGRGVRDLAAAREGFLVLAGPVGDGPGSYQLYLWDGGDCLPGVRTTGGPGGSS